MSGPGPSPTKARSGSRVSRAELRRGRHRLRHPHRPALAIRRAEVVRAPFGQGDKPKRGLGPGPVGQGARIPSRCRPEDGMAARRRRIEDLGNQLSSAPRRPQMAQPGRDPDHARGAGPRAAGRRDRQGRPRWPGRMLSPFTADLPAWAGLHQSTCSSSIAGRRSWNRPWKPNFPGSTWERRCAANPGEFSSTVEPDKLAKGQIYEFRAVARHPPHHRLRGGPRVRGEEMT